MGTTERIDRTIDHSRNYSCDYSRTRGRFGSGESAIGK